MKKILPLVLFSIFFVNTLFADGTLMSWGMNDLKGMTEAKFNAAKTWSKEEILQKTLEANTWPDTYLLAVAANQKKDSLITQLIELLNNSTVTKLQLTSRLIIWERILSDDILFEGKGLQIDDDLFSVAGRANWILRVITKKNFGFVKPNSTTPELEALQTKWNQWHAGKATEEYINPFDTKEKGLNEIHSLVAFEALIYSLKPSDDKEALTKSCLKRIYQLDQMPADKGSPANYCNPDTYTFNYVNSLTGEKKLDESKNHTWWAKWWEKNKNKLVWNKEKAIFEIGK